MKTSRYIEAQILAILRQAEGGMPVAELCRAHGTSSASFYKWRAQYGGMDASLISQMKVMEEENRRLRRMYADLSMRADLLSSGVPQGQHCAGLPGLWCQRDLLSLWPKVARRERGNRGSSGRPDGRQEDLGVRAVFPAPAHELEPPANPVRFRKAKDGWRELTEGEVDLCLQPITASTNNALARGRTPLSALEKHEVVNALRSRHLAKINAEVEEYRGSVLDRIRDELEGLTEQVSAYFLAEIRNRELNLERRRQAPPEAGPVELWQGQVAALERSLSMARLNFSEATDFLQGLAAGHHLARTVQPCTILLALIAEE